MSSRFPRKREGVKNENKIIHIFTEGKRTEPDYFDALKDELKLREINIKVKIIPFSRQTTSLVREAINRVERDSIITDDTESTDDVWVVFDKDDETDFDNAIDQARANHFKVAYSNEAFELWYYLHFHRLGTRNTRDQYIEMIEREIAKKLGVKKYKYEKKSSKEIYKIIRDGQENAIKFANSLEQEHADEHNHNNKCPCTTVHHLVLELTALKPK
jgi:ribosomal protein L22